MFSQPSELTARALPLCLCSQDALAKTVPIWAAVLNRAVARLRSGADQQGAAGPAAAQQGAGAERAAGGGDGGSSCEQGSWGCEVHLPPWVSGNEGHQVQLRLEGWVDELLEVGASRCVLGAG